MTELKMWELSDGFLRENATTILSEQEQKIVSDGITKGGQGSGNFDHEGRPGEVGGSGSGSGESKEYTGNTTVDSDGVVHTDNVFDAVKALTNNKRVDLNQPKDVSVLLDKLQKTVRSLESLGVKAPNFNLCNVTVKGSNLFCVESKGIARIKMPQLKGSPIEGSKAFTLPKDSRGEVDSTGYFVDYLKEKGLSMVTGEERADFLKATQNELNGVKVAGIADALRQGKLDVQSLIVSKDNYIIDGHHRWAATVAVDYEDNHPGDLKMPIVRVDAGIIQLLAEAKKFTKDFGLQPVGV